MSIIDKALRVICLMIGLVLVLAVIVLDVIEAAIRSARSRWRDYAQAWRGDWS